MRSGGSSFKLFVLLAMATATGVYLSYGTISPCGMLRAQIRKADSLAAVLPDGLVDAVIADKLGSLTPGRCISALLQGNTPIQPKLVSNPPSRAIVPSPAGLESKIEAAAMECRARRLKGELKNFRESTLCSNDKITNAFRETGYPNMDLITRFTAGRIAIAEKIDRNQITEAQGQNENRQLFLAIAAEERNRFSNAATVGH